MTDFLVKSKEALVQFINHGDNNFQTPITMDDVYVTWFSKTLQNHKALYYIPTDEYNSCYFEVTYNGDKKETYIDTYKKISNNTVADFE